jgi:two-component system chemotaxis sensor kinase CheA
MEYLDQFDQDLLAIENKSNDEETLHRIFRAIHTIKGSSGCLGLRELERMAHAGENLLSWHRDRAMTPGADTVRALFRFCDALRGLIHQLSNGPEAAQSLKLTPEHQQILADLNSLHQALKQEQLGGFQDSDAGSFGLFADEPAPPAAPSAVPAPPVASDEPAPKPAVETSVASDTAIRVAVSQLDVLMDLVGELVLTRNQILGHTSALLDPGMAKSAQRLNLITSQLQEKVMKTRMQAVGHVWNKFPRVVRDLSKELGKPVALVMEGSDTEIDRTLLEAIKDPLTHIVRNSLDHGIESPERRRAAQKSPRGEIKLRAFHDGGQVVIEVSDDGGGIDRERVLRKAIERGLVSPDQASAMPDSEVYGLIFSPGFSTAEAVTNISGRGVGMDVVKSNVERIGGAVVVESEPGRSTTVRLKIPLTLAIIPALLILAGGNRYAISQASLVELVRIDEEKAATAIESIRGCPLYRLRGQLLPLLYLREQLGLSPDGSGGALLLLVLEAEGRQFGMIVDDILDTEEIVVKPLGQELKNLSVYAGATILGDGRVALILDVLGMARRAGLLEDGCKKRATEDGFAAAADTEVLLAHIGSNRQVAVHLDSVARLEQIPVDRIEWSGNSEVVQYRNSILPLIAVGSVLGVPPSGDTRESGKIPVVVYSHEGAQYGLVVDRIVDIVRCAAAINPCANRPGILGSAVVAKRVTDFLDVPALVSVSGVVSYKSNSWGLF